MKKRLFLLSLFSYVTMEEVYAANLTMSGSIALGGETDYSKCEKYIGRIIKTSNAYIAYLNAGAFEVAAEEVQKNKENQKKLKKCEKNEGKWYKPQGVIVGIGGIF
ncbi:MAG: hypothetical protein Q8S31_00855 [Alphaproteobacteria bacterium]|nr:hypothetical protein [Alphaproteobacteria bacterium]